MEHRRSQARGDEPAPTWINLIMLGAFALVAAGAASAVVSADLPMDALILASSYALPDRACWSSRAAASTPSIRSESLGLWPNLVQGLTCCGHRARKFAVTAS